MFKASKHGVIVNKTPSYFSLFSWARVFFYRESLDNVPVSTFFYVNIDCRVS